MTNLDPRPLPVVPGVQARAFGLVLGLGLGLVFSASASFAQEQGERYPPPFHIEKVPIEKNIYPFDLTDLDGRRWYLPSLGDKPVVLLTGHHELRFDLQAWGTALQREFVDPGLIHLLWVVNLCGHPFTDHLSRAEDFWREFRPPIPLALDPHAQVGRNRRLDYRIPNVLGIDRTGRLVFHEMAPLSSASLELFRAKLNRLLKNRGFGDSQ